MQKAVLALNSIGSLPWAVLLILIGLSGTFVFARYHFDAGLAHDIGVAGITLLTNQAIRTATKTDGAQQVSGSPEPPFQPTN